MKAPGERRTRARLSAAVGRWGPQVAVRYARLVERVRQAQLAAAARLRRSQDNDTSWLASWALAIARGVLVAVVAAGAVLAVKAALADTMDGWQVPALGEDRPIVWVLDTPENITAGAVALGLRPDTLAYAQWGREFGRVRGLFHGGE